MGGIGGTAKTRPGAPALLTMEGAITFGRLDERQRALAGLLRSGGVGPGERVAVLSANRPELIETTTGCLRAGVVPVPLSPLLTPPEISYLLEDSGARWLFSDRSIESPPGLERTITFGDAYERCLHEAEPGELADYTLTRPMHYTSGTTGLPKGVWVPPANPDVASAAAEDFISLWGLRDDDVHLVCSPLTHSGPYRYVLRTLEAGGAVVVQRRFDAAETLAAIELFSATSTFMVPTHLERIFGLHESALWLHDVSSMRLLAHAGAPIREVTKRRAMDFFPPGSVWEFYGSTEGQATRISPGEWLQVPGSVGRALPGAELFVLDEVSREPAGVGEIGMVWVRNPGAERFEYWGDEAKTREAWHEGAFTVGDLGRLDEDGYLFLAGRRTDLVISGGVNVYPLEVEHVLLGHPGVGEALVYGEPHEEWGQQVLALVVAAPGHELDPEALRAWARDRLAGYKCPRSIKVVAELPRTSTGKLKRLPPA